MSARPWLVFVFCVGPASGAFAQDLGHAPEPNPPRAEEAPAPAMPAAARHPLTGERGTWIPDWLKLRHLQDEERLKMCTVELSLGDDEIADLQSVAGHLRAALDLGDQVETKLELALAHSNVERERAIRQAQRRSATMWVFIGGFVLLSGVLVLESQR